MTEITKEDVHFKRNLRIYFNLIKKYKGIIFILFFLLVIVELTYLVDKFLFKIIIDRGGEFLNGSLARSDFVSLLLIIAAIYLSAVLIRPVIKFAAGIEFCHDNLKSGDIFTWMYIYRNSPAVVRYLDSVAFVYQYCDVFTESGERLVNGVVYDFVDKMV